jgi:hypothetical protein
MEDEQRVRIGAYQEVRLPRGSQVKPTVTSASTWMSRSCIITDATASAARTTEAQHSAVPEEHFGYPEGLLRLAATE